MITDIELKGRLRSVSMMAQLGSDGRQSIADSIQIRNRQAVL
jgi:hypothetical protein